MSDADPFGACYRGKRVLVTGHTGFKGAWLSTWLLGLGADVCGISLRGAVSEPSLFDVLALDRRVRHVEADIRDPHVMRDVVEDVEPDVVFHLAAQSIVRRSFGDPLGTLSTNAMGTAHVLDALRQHGGRCVAVLITSDKAYRNQEWEWGYRETDELGGHDPYSGSKGCAELVIRAYHTSYFASPTSPVRIAITRAGNVIGGGDWAPNRLVPDCVRSWSGGRPVEVRNPGSTRPWQHVLDPLSGYLALGYALLEGDAVAGEPFNFGPVAEMSASVAELIEALGQHCDFATQPRYLQANAVEGPREAALLKLNCDKALTRLCWRPTLSFEETVTTTAAWYDAFYGGGHRSMLEFTTSQIDAYVGLARERGLSWAAPPRT